MSTWDTLLKEIQAHGGITCRLATMERPTKGYAVAVSKDLERVAPVLTRKVLKAYIQEHADILRRDGMCLGAWQDAGLWYLDCSKVVPSALEARRVALEHNQLAFFDLANMVTIPVT